MLTYRNAVLALAGAAVICGLLWATAGVSLWWFCLPLASYVGGVAYGSARISSSFFIETTGSGNTTRQAIALTFDDGPVSTTPLILEILRKHEAPAAFFCIGNRVVKNPDLLKQIADEGHLIGNHSFSHHFLFDLFSTRKFTAEIAATDNAIAAVIGRRPRLFRPPYGVTTPNLARAIRKAGHVCIGWSVRSLDTVITEDRKLLGNMLTALKPGAVFLFHDSSLATVKMLDEFIEQAKRRGFSVVPLDQLFHIAPYE
ncbi:MAG: polysaccharide deacetylase family protein [Hymenobacter sp.]|nr:polysaccharide deacetylase family protein [Hymenobacter sp.]